MALIIQNITSSNIDLDDLGFSLSSNQSLNLSSEVSSEEVVNSALDGNELSVLVSSGDIVVKDPTDINTNLSIDHALIALRAHNDSHFSTPPIATVLELADIDATEIENGSVLRFNQANSNFDFVKTKIAFSRNNTSLQNINGPVAADVPLMDDVVIEDVSHYTIDAVEDLIRVKKESYYKITYSVYIQSLLGNNVEIGFRLYKNGSELGALKSAYIRGGTSGASSSTCFSSEVFYLLENDEIQLRSIRQGNSTSDTFLNGAGNSYIEIENII